MIPTAEQQRQIDLSIAWDMLDEGLSDADVIDELMGAGAPRETAELIVSRVREAQTKSVHTGEQREELVQQLEQAISDEDHDAIRAVILEGGVDERTFDKLLNAVADPVLFGQTKGADAFAYALSIFLLYEDEMIRSRAALALGKMGQHAQSAIPILQKTIDESDDGVRSVAREALAAIQKDMKPWWKVW
jgi:hypothetical protein